MAMGLSWPREMMLGEAKAASEKLDSDEEVHIDRRDPGDWEYALTRARPLNKIRVARGPVAEQEP